MIFDLLLLFRLNVDVLPRPEKEELLLLLQVLVVTVAREWTPNGKNVF